MKTTSKFPKVKKNLLYRLISQESVGSTGVCIRSSFEPEHPKLKKLKKK